MINSLHVAATVKTFEDILSERDVPYEIRQDKEYEYYKKIWDESSEQELALKQVRPAIKRIASKEPYLFKADGEPLVIRLNYLTRKLDEDSFGEIMLERPDIDWRFTISIKDTANVLSTMTVADRSMDNSANNAAGMFNEIDDFGWRIFGIPCSNEYFNDINEILLQFEPLDKDTWMEKLKDDDFLYGKLIIPMLKAVGAEMPRICKDHPEAPRKLVDYFYGTIDYYFIKPIEELEVTRIGCVNSHGGLGRIPGSPNHYTPVTPFATKLEDVRFATGRYGEISKDTLQVNFDGGWSVCFTIHINEERLEERDFALNVYLPVTPYGSYRDQVKWEK